jgi:membrane protein YdbS with pleckstrin-like domain
MYDEVVDKISQLMTAAFGLVAALAWNEAIKAAITSMGFAEYGLWVYAIVVTVIAVLMVVWIGKIAAKAKDLDDRLKGKISRKKKE